MGGKTYNRATKSDKRTWIIGSIIIVVILALALITVVRFFYVGSTAEIVSVADEFKPQPGWKLVSEQIEPPRGFCVDVECPSVSRRWETQKPLNHDEFSSLLEKQGWDFKIDGNCVQNMNNFGTDVDICSASTSTSKYLILTTVSASNPANKAFVSLNIEEKDNYEQN